MMAVDPKAPATKKTAELKIPAKTEPVNEDEYQTVAELEKDYPKLCAEIRVDEAKKAEDTLRKKLTAEIEKKLAAEKKPSQDDRIEDMKKDIRGLIAKHTKVGQFVLALRYVEQGHIGLAKRALDNGRKALKGGR